MFQHPRVSVSVRVVVIHTHKSVISNLAPSGAQGVAKAQLLKAKRSGAQLQTAAVASARGSFYQHYFNQFLRCLLIVVVSVSIIGGSTSINCCRVCLF